MAEPAFQRYRGTRQNAQSSRARLDRRDAEAIYFDQVMPRLKAAERPVRRRSRREEKVKQLYQDGLRNRINPDNLFADTPEKLFALRSFMGYRSLRGSARLEDASPAQIGEVYKKDFYCGQELI